MKNHCYMKVGGPADLLVEVADKNQLIEAYRLTIKHKLPVFLLGSGSNIIVGDGGIRGVVIKNRADNIKTVSFQGGIKNKLMDLKSAVIEAESGTITNHLVRHTIEESLAGLEYFLGLPGTVGGAIYNNSHYQGELIGDYITSVTVVDKKGRIKSYTNAQMKFAYDRSIIQKTKELIVSAHFSLKGGNKDELWEKATGFAKNRAATQPLSSASSGCIFQNITDSQARMLGLSHTKSAGYLIDQSGLKGLKIGGAQVSDKHANFIVNSGNATAMDIWKLIKKIKREVKKKFGITIKPEVFFVGEA